MWSVKRFATSDVARWRTLKWRLSASIYFLECSLHWLAYSLCTKYPKTSASMKCLMDSWQFIWNVRLSNHHFFFFWSPWWWRYRPLALRHWHHRCGHKHGFTLGLSEGTRVENFPVLLLLLIPMNNEPWHAVLRVSMWEISSPRTKQRR